MNSYYVDILGNFSFSLGVCPTTISGYPLPKFFGTNLYNISIDATGITQKTSQGVVKGKLIKGFGVALVTRTWKVNSIVMTAVLLTFYADFCMA